MCPETRQPRQLDPELAEAECRVYLLEVMLQARVPNPHLIGLLGRSYLIMNNPLYWFMFKLSVPHGIANEDVIPQNPGELSCKVKESSFFTDNFF